jgi:RND superfamily putative drug exporter
MFSVQFGLDYEVFLVSRTQDQWLRTGGNQEAVRNGQASAGRVSHRREQHHDPRVFPTFLLDDSIIIKQFAVGLAAATITDAFIARTVPVPALRHVPGRANWWLPGGIGRCLPALHIKRKPAAAPQLDAVSEGRGRY